MEPEGYDRSGDPVLTVETRNREVVVVQNETKVEVPSRFPTGELWWWLRAAKPRLPRAAHANSLARAEGRTYPKKRCYRNRVRAR